MSDSSTVEILPAGLLFEKGGFTEPRNLFSSRRWIDVLAAEYGFDFQVAVSSSTQEQLLFARHDDLMGKRISSLPFSDYIHSDIDADSLLLLLERLAEVYPDHSLTYKSDFEPLASYREAGWRITREAIFHRVAVGQEQEMWGNLSSSFRRGVNKAIKDGVEISFRSDPEAIDRFYLLYSWLRKKNFHIIPQSLSFVQAVHREFIESSAGFVIEASLGDRLLASILCLIHRDIIYYKFGASDIEALDSRPNNLLFWHLLLRASEQGFKEVDLGLSGKSQAYAGLIRFKEGLGGDPRPITYFRKDPAGFEDKHEKEFKKLLSDLTSLFVEESTDIKVAQKAGQAIYRYFA